MTTNPTIFARAITDSDSYAGQIGDLQVRQASPDQALRELTTHDVRQACDVLRPVYDATGGVDGRVSIEVDPRIAHDTAAHRGRGPRAVVAASTGPTCSSRSRPPGRACPAISACLAEGISINVTLIFSLARYGEVIEAFLTGHGTRSRRRTGPVRHRLGRLVLRVPGRHRGRPAAGQARHRAGRRAARQGRDRQRPARLPALRGDRSPPAGGSRSRRRAPGRSARCGRPPASRTPPTTTPGMSPTWSRPVWSTPCRRRR